MWAFTKGEDRQYVANGGLRYPFNPSSPQVYKLISSVRTSLLKMQTVCFLQHACIFLKYIITHVGLAG